MHLLKNSLVAVGLALLLASCDKDRFFDEYKSFDGKWNKDSIVAFNVDQKDTTGRYNLYVTMRNSNEYAYSNIFLIVKMSQPGTNIAKVDTLEYKMANPDGTLMGDGFGSIKESSLWYKERVRFPKAGNYKFSIQQAVRENGKIPGVQELEGVTEVGLRIEKAE
ncbi:gliding motility protein GldH [Flavobacterium akiainvivens]|uniref:Gliding motility protein GldH n=1 Tax=Flavobacterium akiainvivens TaxID=1202724 RepID=A0A0M8MIH8_9FLAO|nr:gliding motility lipoprotein GldH [Flavobacterium akiainvivens]KOS06921.1 gliding motility protein GldH [Flavobacterium akiainvivens]SFQ69841.1 protein involved in gliding motility GldH [Flavobacterium akiainvivens]